MMLLNLVAATTNACNFDKSPTIPILIFEGGIGLGAIVTYLLLAKIKDKTWQRFLIMAAGVLIFELFTAPMWQNLRLGSWAYVYEDVSWILTLGWTCLILSVVLVVDRLLPQWREYQRFALYLGILTTIVFPIEILVVSLGIRRYSQEVLEVTSHFKQVAGTPIEALYYIPVFIGLIISFYKYWSFVLDDEPLVPLKRRKWLRSIGLTFLGVFLFEVMIEPMAENAKLPAWSYIFHDISILLTGMWVLIIGLVAVLVTRFFQHFPTLPRFLVAVTIATALALPIETSLIHNGYRIYGASATANFSGYLTPLFNIPLEVVFAIPFYMALIIAFIRYWETLLDNRL